MGQGTTDLGALAQAQRLAAIAAAKAAAKAAAEAAAKAAAEAAAREQQLAQQTAVPEQPAPEAPCTLPTIDKATFVDNVKGLDNKSEAELNALYDEFSQQDGQAGLSNSEFEQLFLAAVTEKVDAGADDDAVMKMLGQLSDGDLDALTTDKKKEMIAQLVAGYTSGAEDGAMGRLAASIARKEPAAIDQALIDQLSDDGVRGMVDAMGEQGLAELLLVQGPAGEALGKNIVTMMRAELDSGFPSEADTAAIKQIDTAKQSKGGNLSGERVVNAVSGLNKQVAGLKKTVDGHLADGQVDDAKPGDTSKRQALLAEREAYEATKAASDGVQTDGTEAPKETDQAKVQLARIKNALELAKIQAPEGIVEGSEASNKIKNALKDAADLVAQNPQLKTQVAGLLDKLGGITNMPAALAAPAATMAGLFSGVKSDGSPMSGTEYTQSMMELPGQMKDLGETSEHAFAAIKACSKHIPGVERVVVAAENAFKSIAEAATKFGRKVADGMADMVGSLLTKAMGKGTLESAESGLTAVLRVLGPILQKANILLTAVTTTYDLVDFLATNIYNPARLALSEGLGMMKYGENPNTKFDKIESRNASVQDRIAKLDKNAPDYPAQYHVAAKEAALLNQEVQNELASPKGTRGMLMNDLSNAYDKAIVPALKSVNVMQVGGKVVTAHDLYLKKDRTPTEELKLAEVLGPAAQKFLQAEMVKDDIPNTAIDADRLSLAEAKGMDPRSTLMYITANEADLDKLAPDVRTHMMEKCSGFNNGEDYDAAIGKLMAASLKALPVEEQKAAYESLLAKNYYNSKDDVVQSLVASMTVPELAKLSPDVRKDMIKQLVDGSTNDVESAQIGKLMASFVPVAPASATRAEKAEIAKGFDQAELSALTLMLDANGVDNAMASMVKHLDESQLANLPAAVQSSLVVNLTHDNTSDEENQMVAKLANALLRNAETPEAGHTAYQGVMKEVSWENKDDVAFYMAKELTRGELGSFDKRVVTDMHSQIEGGVLSVVTAEEREQLTKLADYKA